ncbi:MAG: CotH kinase family protein [Bacteroidota bacterium]
MFKATFLLILIAVFSLNTRLNAQVMINEYSCSNLSQFVDNYGKYEDWIEIYNAGGTSVNLSGYYLSDDSINNLKWQLPAGISISAHGYLKFWASGRNEVTGTSYHTSFKLTQTKNNHEFIVLSNPSGTILDYVVLSRKTQLGHSLGRTLDGASAWSLFKTPTPGASNNTATPYFAYADKPDVTLSADFYTSPQTVTITTTEPNADIRYTLDGKEPSASSMLYTFPINLSTTSVLKAITISADPEILPSFVRYNTYFFNVSHTTVVVSISGTQLDNLANGNGNLIPFGTVEYFNLNHQRSAHSYGEFNRHGQDSWANSQRSIDFIARDEMGDDHALQDKIFTRTNRNSFQRIIFRAAGDDNYPADHHPANAGSAHLRDAYVHSLAEIGGMDLDVRRAEKCVVYLNGQYWGVYDLRERCEDHDYTEYNYGQDKYHLQYIMVWGNTWAEYGGQQALDDWHSLYNYILANNMSHPANFQYVSDRFDWASLVDYTLVNSLTVCSDWLNWNLAWWRGLDSTGTHKKWGYILWDNDAVYGFYINYTGIPSTLPTAAPCNPEGLSGSSDPEFMMQVLSKLRQNPAFEQYYIARQIDLYNTVFSCNNLIPQLDSTKAIIEPEMAMQAARWNGTVTEWQINYTQLRNFILNRCAYLPTGIKDCYTLNGPYNLTVKIDPPNSGSIKMNSLNLLTFPWTGNYFGNIKTLLTATPTWNYIFDHWSSGSQSFYPWDTCKSVNFDLNGSDTVIAHFSYYAGINPTSEQKPTVELFPNVFREYTTLAFTLPKPMPVEIKLLSPMGSLISDIVKPGSIIGSGNQSMMINLADKGLAAGTYLLDFRAGSFRKAIKLIYSPY